MIYFETFGDFVKVTAREFITRYARSKVFVCVINVTSYCIQRIYSGRLGSIRSYSGVVSSHLIMPPEKRTKMHDQEWEITRSLKPTELHASQIYVLRTRQHGFKPSHAAYQATKRNKMNALTHLELH